MISKTDFPIIFFDSQKKWRNWLAKNYSTVDGVWLQFYKKDSGVKSLKYAEALDEALCFGWIDGQSKSLDEKSYLQKFTPRRKRSLWSKRNIEKVEQLIKDRKMHKAGIEQIEAAKADGRWQKAYDSPANMKMPEDFLKELSKKPKALKFFNTLNKTNTYAIAWRLQTAKKPETRERRMKIIIEMLNKGEKFH
jgi:uncharacterized protein YdeI (YjbR/CyaY-like superfamily)